MITVDAAITRFVQILRDLAPKDTGNLAYNAIRFEKLNEREWRIYVDMAIAPYQQYVNDSPTLSNGKPNPNYKWLEAALELALEEIANLLGGTLEF